ncbi:MAG: ELWxxDGT repeat protein, partial [Synechococcaceae cyanobacterium]
KTDGTTTSRVANIYPGEGNSNSSYLTAVGNTLFFSASDFTSGFELWKTDGTTTSRVADIRPGISSSKPRYLTAVGNTLFFTANDGSSGYELWKTDGTTTSRVADISPGAFTSDPRYLTAVGHTLFFSATDDSFGSGSGRELWKTDGTTTSRVADIRPGGFGSGSSPNYLTAVGNTLFFTADDGSTGRELWALDIAAAPPPDPFALTKVIGTVAFGSTLLGYAIKQGTAAPIEITYAGTNVSANFPGAGWSGIAAAARGAGFDLYFKNTNGSYAVWNLNGSGVFTGGSALSPQQLFAAESSLTADLDGDGAIGLSFAATRTIGAVAFGANQLGYAIKQGTAAPIEITYAGTNVSANFPGAGWSGIAAAARGAGFDLYFKNTNGSYAVWNLDGSGVFTAGRALSAAEVLSEEVSIRGVLTGDSQIGPFALRGGGGPQADALTGLADSVTFGFAGADTLTGGSASTSGFDILIGGTGNDSYVLPSGRSTLIVDLGGDAADSFTSTALSLNGASTSFATLDGGRHLVISDSGSNTRVYLYDWQSTSNKIESFQLTDGTFSFLQLQQKVAALGSSVPNTTWESWDSQFGNNQLAKVGFASGASMDKLVDLYTSVDATGVLV